VGEGETVGTSSGEAGMGRGRKLAWAGSVPLGLLFCFFVLFYFPFSIFSFLSYLLQKCFNSNQTTFRNFLKINAMI
jgi:multisubunit Na+/H+ antiporter MnhB subunit